MRLGRALRRIRDRLAGAPSSEHVERVRQAMAEHGRWEQHVEWRVSTVTSTLIEHTREEGYRKYLVRVECDYVLEARCPTLTRAIEVAEIYEQLIPGLWQRFGWPSWASRTKLEADRDAR